MKKFDVLHNFISPVTGRILANFNYVLVGNSQGVAIPSPILIDIRLDLIALKKRYNTLVEGDILIGHENEELPNAQVLMNLADGFLYNTAGTVSTTIIIPIESLPDLTYQYVWTGDDTNRPIEVQRLILNNLPPMTTVNPLVNFGYRNLYTCDINPFQPLDGIIPVTTLQLDMSNFPNLPVGYIWRGAVVPPSVPPFYIDSIPPFIHGEANYGLNRPVASDSLLILEGKVDVIEEDIITINTDIAGINADLVAINATLYTPLIGLVSVVAGLVIDVAAINATLYTPLIGLVSVVGGLVITVAGLTTSVGILLTRTLNNVPLATGDVNLNNNRIINLSDPVNPLDAVNLQTLQTYIGGTGTVTSVSGTTGQIIVVTGTTTPVISIDPTYAGQTSIVTLGTITTGVWNGAVIDLAHGGTNASLIASNGGIVYSTATAMNILGGTATANQVLLSGSTSAPSWSTTVFPSTTTINQLLYSSSTNVIGGLSTANNSVLLTNGSGVPAWQTLASSIVTSIIGTANQITVSSSTGVVTLSLPADVIITTAVTAGNLKLITNTLQSTNTNGDINIVPNGTGGVIVGANAGATIYTRLPSGQIYMQGNLLINTVTANVYQKIVGITTSSQLNKFSMPVNNRLTYTGTSPIIGAVHINLTYSGNNNNAVISVAIFRNGVIETPSIMSKTFKTAGSPQDSLGATCFISMVTNDYVEVFIKSTSNDSITVSNLIFTISTT